jgi:large subunit ribosomal protein L1
MAKKAELLEQAKSLHLEVTDKNTIAEIEAAIATAGAVDAEAEIAKDEKHTAKAGKRSEKSLREAEEAAEKAARKDAGDTSSQGDEETIKKGPAPKTRSRVERKGKNYREASAKVEKGKLYSLADALTLAADTNPTKFDASVELHVVLGVDPRQADQNVRSMVSLPHGTGKTIRVAAFVPNEDAESATTAGADISGEDEVVKLLEKGQMDFDVLVATPQMMPKLGKFARVLGPRGLMPNPKSGTVATNVAQAVKSAKGGRVEYRVDKQGIVHLAAGKVSFGGDNLLENAKSFFASLDSVKPSTLKGGYIKSVSVSTTMGPGIKVDLATI